MKTLLYTLFLIILLMNCSSKTETTAIQLSADNPFNVNLNYPIDYANVTGDDITEYVDVTIKNATQEIEILKNLKSLTFENTFVALDKINNELSKAYSNAHMFFWVSTDSIARAKGLEGFQKLAPLFTDIYSDKGLFSQIEKFAQSDAYKELTGHRKILVDDAIVGFKQSGVNLEAENLEKYKKLNEEINELTSQYSTNMNTANLVLTLDENGAEGLPVSFKEKYKTENGAYEIPIMNSSRGPVMSNAKSEATRKDFTTKYSNRGADKNLVILDSLVSKKVSNRSAYGF